MKTREEIVKRLHTLRLRYVKKAVKASQERGHRNCSHNYEHIPVPRPGSGSCDMDLAPRRSVTLLVIQPDQPIRLCMHGSEDPATWSGDLCDSDDVSRSCPKFKAKTTTAEAAAEANRRMSDDDWVLENMKDVAALQWAVDDRIYRHEMTVVQRLVMWFINRFTKVPRALSPAKGPVDIPPDFWDDNDPPVHS